MSGIFRDVYMLRRPDNHIHDYHVKVTMEENFSRATLEVKLFWRGNPQTVKYRLIAPDGSMVSKEQTKDNFTINVNQPLLWNPPF